jgi:hypothetical protein
VRALRIVCDKLDVGDIVGKEVVGGAVGVMVVRTTGAELQSETKD